MKEDRKAYSKAYYRKNKKRIQEYKLAYREERRDKLNAKAQANKAALKNSFYTLYYMPEEHYVGVSSQPILRMRNHRAAGKITADWETIATFETRTEALKIESFMHSLGYIGACEWNTNRKKYI
tara:strand:- start:204 stop:575 length:372 start_codon:yes stop_codon:yes gene_type:complete